MKAIVFPLMFTLTAGMALAAAPASRASKSTTAASDKAEKATKSKGEVVSTEGDKLVVKTATGDQTFTATGAVAATLHTLHVGEQVTVKSRNNELVSVKEAKKKAPKKAA